MNSAAFECGICLEMYEGDIDSKIPRLLECGHTICSGCIGLSNAKFMKCPYRCNQTTSLKGGVVALKKNFALLEIIASLPKKDVDTVDDSKTKRHINTEERLAILQRAYDRIQIGLTQQTALEQDKKNRTVTGSVLRQNSQRLHNLNAVMEHELADSQEPLDEYAESVDNQIKFKVVILGDSDVGKTSLAYYFTHGDSCVETSTLPTQSIEQKKLKKQLLTRNIELVLSDTPGQNKFFSALGPACRDVDAMVLVFDATKPETLVELTKRIPFLLNQTRNDNPIIFILGNKVDAPGDMADQSYANMDLSIVESLLASVSKELLQPVAQPVDGKSAPAPVVPPFISYYYVSAKTGYNCADVMKNLQLQIAYQNVFGQHRTSTNGRKIRLRSADRQNNDDNRCC